LISEATDSVTEQIYFDNTDRVETKGASIELEAKFKNGISGRASYTFQNTTDEATGNTISNSPHHLAKLNLILPLYRDKVFSGLELHYMSEVEGTRGASVGGHVLANWTLFSRELVKGMEVSASVYNLFDSDYRYTGGPEHIQDSLPQDGRTFRVKVTYRF
jgi:outer membrane receptor for ferrienterochelin and colicins